MEQLESQVFLKGRCKDGKVDNLLRRFILSDGFDIRLPTDADNEKTNYLEDYSNFETLSMVATDRVKDGDKQ